jgi:hypothetical protein
MKVNSRRFIKVYYKKMWWFHMVIKKMDRYVVAVDKILKKKDRKVSFTRFININKKVLWLI